MITKKFDKAKFLTTILPILVRGEEEILTLELDNHYAFISYNKQTRKFFFDFSFKSVKLESDFFYFLDLKLDEFKDIVSFSLSNYSFK